MMKTCEIVLPAPFPATILAVSTSELPQIVNDNWPFVAVVADPKRPDSRSSYMIANRQAETAAPWVARP